MCLRRDLKHSVLHGMPNTKRQPLWPHSSNPWTCPAEKQLTRTLWRSSKVLAAVRAACCQRHPSRSLLSRLTWNHLPRIVRTPFIWRQHCITHHLSRRYDISCQGRECCGLFYQSQWRWQNTTGASYPRSRDPLLFFLYLSLQQSSV